MLMPNPHKFAENWIFINYYCLSVKYLELSDE